MLEIDEKKETLEEKSSLEEEEGGVSAPDIPDSFEKEDVETPATNDDLPDDKPMEEGTEPSLDEPSLDEPLDGKQPQMDNPSSDEPIDGTLEEPKPEKTFSQEQVNRLVGEARAEGRNKGFEAGYAKARAELLDRYGVEGDDELDGIFRDGGRYGELNQRFMDAGNQLRETQTELALVRSQILPERYGDVKAILGASGLDVTDENIASMLPTHQEWIAKPQDAPIAPAVEEERKPIPQPTPDMDGADKGMLGQEPPQKQEEATGESEEERVMRDLYKLK